MSSSTWFAAVSLSLIATTGAGCTQCKSSDGGSCSPSTHSTSPGSGGTTPATSGTGGTTTSGTGGTITSGIGGNSGSGGSGAAGAGGTITAGTGGTPIPGAGGITGTGGGAGDLDDGSVISAGVRWLGRVDATTTIDHPRFAWSGSGFVARFTGARVSVTLKNAGPFVFKAVVDGAAQPAFATTTGQGSYVIANIAVSSASAIHTVELSRQTEGVYGESQLVSITVEGAGAALLDPPRARPRQIEVFGASVSCGYGDLGAAPCSFTYATESHYDTYAAVAARALDADLTVTAISGRGVIRNSDGSTAGTIPSLYERVLPASTTPVWDFHTHAQAVVINLGKNDLATGDPGQPFVDGYVAFVHTLRGRFPDALIVASTGPNLGGANHALQVTYVRSALDRVHAEGDNRVELLDWPEETAAETGCDVHPTVAKHRSMGAALAALLSARLGW